MKFITVNRYEELSQQAADIICKQVISKPNSVLGLATGSTPLGTYAKMVERCNNVDFSNVISVNLDEYIGLTKNNEQSYRYFMDTNLFSKINIRPEHTYVPNGCATDLTKECERYDALIQKLGGIDLQLLGIGLDGHIGFNEPDDIFEKNTHIVSLDPSTIKANARFFNSEAEVPCKAITMGILPIMQAKKVLLIANGKNKREILNQAFYGPITPKVPASILQLHPDVTVIFSEN